MGFNGREGDSMGLNGRARGSECLLLFHSLPFPPLGSHSPIGLLLRGCKLQSVEPLVHWAAAQ